MLEAVRHGWKYRWICLETAEKYPTRDGPKLSISNATFSVIFYAVAQCFVFTVQKQQQQQQQRGGGGRGLPTLSAPTLSGQQ